MTSGDLREVEEGLIAAIKDLFDAELLDEQEWTRIQAGGVTTWTFPNHERRHSTMTVLSRTEFSDICTQLRQRGCTCDAERLTLVMTHGLAPGADGVDLLGGFLVVHEHSCPRKREEQQR